MSAHADMALAQRCATGDPGGFEELYRVYSSRLFSLACRMVGPTEAEDLLQEIFLSNSTIRNGVLTIITGEYLEVIATRR